MQFGEALAGWRSLASLPAVTPAELTTNLKALYAAIYDADFAALEFAAVRAIAHSRHRGAVRPLPHAARPVARMAGCRLADAEAPLAARNAMRVLRYTIDIVGEVASRFERLAPGQARLMRLHGPGARDAAASRHARRASSLELRAGDVLLVRGQLHNSAAIARVGDVDTQFSHIGIIHIDDVRPALDGRRPDRGRARSLTPLDSALDHGSAAL